MKPHHLGALIAAAVLAVVAGLWTSSLRETETSAIGTPLLPGLAEAVNEVTGVRLIGPGNETIASLSRDDETWRLAEKAGHRANVPKVRELLLRLSRAKLLEEKTSNPEYYKRLGVDSIDSEDAAGMLVEFEGIDVPSVIIGNTEPAREAAYARRAGEQTSWLVSGSIDVADDVLEWLGRNVIDVSSSQIAEVEITHPDGEVVLVSKAGFGQPNFDVANIPNGRELKRASIANAIASVIEGLEIDDALTADTSGFSELTTTRATYRSFDGYVVHADVAEKDDKYYVQFSAAADAAIAARYLPSGDQKPAADDAIDASDTGSGDETAATVTTPGPVAGPLPPPEPDMSGVAEKVEKQNEVFAGWVYALPKPKYEQMTRRISDLLKDPA